MDNCQYFKVSIMAMHIHSYYGQFWLMQLPSLLNKPYYNSILNQLLYCINQIIGDNIFIREYCKVDTIFQEFKLLQWSKAGMTSITTFTKDSLS